MFGYVRMSKGELKVKEYDTYRAVYCSLCKYLGKNYGILSRFTLSYDYAFLSLLNMSLSEECSGFKKGRCAFNPLKKCNYCTCTNSLSMPAAAAMIMFYYKLSDNVSDSRGIKRAAFRFVRALFSRTHKKAAALFPETEETIAKYMQKQKAIETADETSLDKASDPTAAALGEIFAACTKDPQEKRVLYRMGYCMGRYVYLLDAACDFEKDVKSGSYNVLKEYCESKAAAAEKVKPQLYACVNEAAKALELVDFKRYKPIIANTVCVGLEDTFLKELKDERSV